MELTEPFLRQFRRDVNGGKAEEGRSGGVEWRKWRADDLGPNIEHRTSNIERRIPEEGGGRMSPDRHSRQSRSSRPVSNAEQGDGIYGMNGKRYRSPFPVLLGKRTALRLY